MDNYREIIHCGTNFVVAHNIFCRKYGSMSPGKPKNLLYDVYPYCDGNKI